MIKEVQKSFFKVMLVLLGFIILTITIFLYLGDENMKNCLCIKIISTILVAIALVTFIVCVWCRKSDDSTCEYKYTVTHDALSISTNKKIIAVVSYSNNYHIDVYDDLLKAINEINENSTVYLCNFKGIIKAEDLEKLVEKNTTIKFVDTNSVIETRTTLNQEEPNSNQESEGE